MRNKIDVSFPESHTLPVKSGAAVLPVLQPRLDTVILPGTDKPFSSMFVMVI